MARRKVPRASDIETLGERLQRLRVHMEPYMTRQQLATRTGLTKETIKNLENDHPRFANTGIRTLMKIAAGLDCVLYFSIRRRSSRSKLDCLPGWPEVPVLPRPKTRVTERHRRYREEFDNSLREKRLQRRLAAQQISSVDTSSSPDWDKIFGVE